MFLKSIRAAAIAASLALALCPSSAQQIGGNASLTASVASSSVALPANTKTYPAVIIAPAVGTTVEVFYALGGSSVAATVSSPSLPSGGICLIVGPNTNVAVITAASSATVRLTQLSQCAPFQSAKNGGSPPPVCSNKLDFSDQCNSQYVAALF